jgi:histidinol-phosphate/aromatic aminotransferase/cobyric acid decarboxylase-like protein
MSTAIEPTAEERQLIRRALGLQTSETVNKNFLFVHEKGEFIPTARALAERGLLVRDPTGDTKSMRVFRVTTAGATAVNKKLKPALRFNP